jgi:hypothetical protein
LWLTGYPQKSPVCLFLGLLNMIDSDQHEWISSSPLHFEEHLYVLPSGPKNPKPKTLLSVRRTINGRILPKALALLERRYNASQ